MFYKFAKHADFRDRNRFHIFDRQIHTKTDNKKTKRILWFFYRLSLSFWRAFAAPFQFRRFFWRPFEKIFGWFRSSASPKSLQNDADADKVEHHSDDDDSSSTTATEEPPAAVQPPTSSDVDQNETIDGMWDEHWRSHFDSKPFGI